MLRLLPGIAFSVGFVLLLVALKRPVVWAQRRPPTVRSQEDAERVHTLVVRSAVVVAVGGFIVALFRNGVL